MGRIERSRSFPVGRSDGETDIAVERAVKNPGHVHPGRNLGPVDLQEPLAGDDPRLLVVRRAVGDHVADEQAGALVVEHESEPEVGGRDGPAGRLLGAESAADRPRRRGRRVRS